VKLEVPVLKIINLSVEFVIFPDMCTPDMSLIGGGIVQFCICGCSTGQVLPPFNGFIVLLIVPVL
jgi:hypothetical protein